MQIFLVTGSIAYRHIKWGFKILWFSMLADL